MSDPSSIHNTASVDISSLVNDSKLDKEYDFTAPKTLSSTSETSEKDIDNFFNLNIPRTDPAYLNQVLIYDLLRGKSPT